MLIKLYLVRINNSRTLPDRVTEHVKSPPTRHLYLNHHHRCPPPFQHHHHGCQRKEYDATGRDRRNGDRERVGKATGARVYKVRPLFSSFLLLANALPYLAPLARKTRQYGVFFVLDDPQSLPLPF